MIYLLFHAKIFAYSTLTNKSSTIHKISIIIPARNEEKNIQKCLQSIFEQNYPQESMEIIVIDDISTDNTLPIVESTLKNSPFSWKIVSLTQSNGKMGKKAAISEGIKLATNPVLLLTDADTVRGKNWVKSMAECLAENIIWVSGPIKMTGNSVFQQMQALESAGLIGLGAAMTNRKKSGLANGANLMYRKSDFEKVNGFSGIDDIASGDDELLIHKFSKLGSGFFCKNREAIVETEATSTFAQFLQQRIRWVSKSRKYENESMTRTLILAWIFHLGFLVLPILIFIFKSKIGLAVYTLMWGLKMFAELSMLIPTTRFLKNTDTLKWFFLEQILYIFYIVGIGIWANVGLKYQWKNRNVK